MVLVGTVSPMLTVLEGSADGGYHPVCFHLGRRSPDASSSVVVRVERLTAVIECLEVHENQSVTATPVRIVTAVRTDSVTDSPLDWKVIHRDAPDRTVTPGCDEVK
jgi:hypothetical protein